MWALMLYISSACILCLIYKIIFFNVKLNYSWFYVKITLLQLIKIKVFITFKIFPHLLMQTKVLSSSTEKKLEAPVFLDCVLLMFEDTRFRIYNC